ncbi:MAG: tRNA(Ile)-lysidine synthase [Firmicutes bacterium]|nr:tRNA(Ile)-lysidine synthase [Bacillota bacterium]
MILAKVRKTISKYKMLASEDRVVVGVSGGPDSVAMLSLLVTLKEEFSLYLHVAHLNHTLRGKEADEDALYVDELSKSFGLSASVSKRDVSALAKKYGLSLQEAGRQARYEFFQAVSHKIKANKIAVAQTMNDQAETMLLWILRGCGLKGLTGIPAVRPYPEPVSEDGLFVIRPLLEVSRYEVMNYLQDVHLKGRFDSSNKKSAYLRNKVRSKLIPLLATYNPHIELNLSRMAAVLKEDEDYLTSVTDETFSSLSEVKNGRIMIDAGKLRELHPALQRRVLRKAIAVLKGDLRKVSNEHIDEMLHIAMADSPGEICLPHCIIGRQAYGKLIILKEQGFTKKNEYAYSLPAPGEVKINEAKMRIKSSFVSPFQEKPEDFESRRVAYFDYARVHLPLTVRNRRQGDIFCPLGIKGKKKIKDFFIDRKIPLLEREQVPLLLSGSEIIWVINQQQSEIGKITGKTKKVLRIEVDYLP